MANILKPFASQSFLVGLGLAAAAYFIGPQLKQALKPAAVKGVQGMMALSGRTMEAFNQSREKLGGVISDMKPRDSKAQLVTDSLGELIRELREERAQSNRMLDELKEAVTGLKAELSGLSGIRNAGAEAAEGSLRS